MPHTIEDTYSVAERAADLGCTVPEGFAILPANFATAANPEEFLYNSAAATVRTLFRTNKIPCRTSYRQASHVDR